MMHNVVVFFFICSTVQTHYRCLKIVRCKNPMVLLYGHGQRGRQTQVSYSFVLFVFWYSRCDWFKLPCLGWVNPKKTGYASFSFTSHPKIPYFLPIKLACHRFQTLWVCRGQSWIVYEYCRMVINPFSIGFTYPYHCKYCRMGSVTMKQNKQIPLVPYPCYSLAIPIVYSIVGEIP